VEQDAVAVDAVEAERERERSDDEPKLTLCSSSAATSAPAPAASSLSGGIAGAGWREGPREWTLGRDAEGRGKVWK
jgi:hypothetical protein